MPLAYDDVPGSWATQSTGWPKLTFTTQEAHDAARQTMIQSHIVPYGSYVSVGTELRVENEAFKELLQNMLAMMGLEQPQVPSSRNQL